MFESLSSAFGMIIEDIILYNNKSFLVPLFLIALLFLWMTEKDRKLRVVLVYLVTAITVIFLCPLYAWIGMRIDKDIYYRVFWTLPIGLLVCYSVVKLMIRFQSVFAKGLVLVLAVIGIALNGKFVYDNQNTIHHRAVNQYHIPQSVIDVADALKLDNYKPIAVLPAELLPFFRQWLQKGWFWCLQSSELL